MNNTKIISFAKQKSGVGKTTTTLNLGTSLARREKKVLLGMDEYIRECICCYAARQIRWPDVQECLADAFCAKG